MIRAIFVAALVVGLSLFCSASASAQVPMNAPPIVSTFDPPPAYGVYLPGSVRVTNFYYATPVTYYPIPSSTVSYFHPSAALVAPTRVHYGLFGRTYVRSPLFRLSFNTGYNF